MLALLISCLVLVLIIIFILILIFRERIEINFSNMRIYGWYNGEILCSSSFSMDMDAEQIKSIEESVRKQLKERIKTYKKIKNL